MVDRCLSVCVLNGAAYRFRMEAAAVTRDVHRMGGAGVRGCIVLEYRATDQYKAFPNRATRSGEETTKGACGMRHERRSGGQGAALRDQLDTTSAIHGTASAEGREPGWPPAGLFALSPPSPFVSATLSEQKPLDQCAAASQSRRERSVAPDDGALVARRGAMVVWPCIETQDRPCV